MYLLRRDHTFLPYHSGAIFTGVTQPVGGRGRRADAPRHTLGERAETSTVQLLS